MFLRAALRPWTIRPRSTARVRRGVLVALAVMAALADVAAAHGPVAPVATSYLATVSSVPAGIEAKVIDGYVRIWLRVSPSMTVAVLDYRHAPYLRFSRSGVQVNLNSTMWYLNQTPVAETPPADLRPSTPPHWQSVSSGHDYEWHDGRLQALAAVALAPGTTYLGRWSIPLQIDGRRGAVSEWCGMPMTRRWCGSGRSWCCWLACSRPGGCAAPGSMPVSRGYSESPRSPRSR
jgi:hypothetical protein